MHVRLLQFGRIHDLLLGTSERLGARRVARIRWYLSLTPTAGTSTRTLQSGSADVFEQMRGRSCPQQS
jgi:hypothetical protein